MEDNKKWNVEKIPQYDKVPGIQYFTIGFKSMKPNGKKISINLTTDGNIQLAQNYIRNFLPQLIGRYAAAQPVNPLPGKQ